MVSIRKKIIPIFENKIGLTLMDINIEMLLVFIRTSLFIYQQNVKKINYKEKLNILLKIDLMDSFIKIYDNSGGIDNLYKKMKLVDSDKLYIDSKLDFFVALFWFGKSYTIRTTRIGWQYGNVIYSNYEDLSKFNKFEIIERERSQVNGTKIQIHWLNEHINIDKINNFYLFILYYRAKMLDKTMNLQIIFRDKKNKTHVFNIENMHY